MEPKQQTPSSGFELPQVNYGQNLEQGSGPATHEQMLDNGAEQFERRGETAGGSVAVPVLPAPVIPLPTVADPIAADEVTVQGAPLAANDDDLIEKEWVDQAKKIIMQTKDDPYRREQEVSRLQADYLRKRYGKELGASQ